MYAPGLAVYSVLDKQMPRVAIAAGRRANGQRNGGFGPVMAGCSMFAELKSHVRSSMAFWEDSCCSGGGFSMRATNFFASPPGEDVSPALVRDEGAYVQTRGV